MEWNDQAVILSTRRHGEHGLVAHVLTEAHGRHAGLVRGGGGRRGGGSLQPGNQVTCRWRARLATHLGTLSTELVKARAAALLDNGGRLTALAAACSVVDVTLPEREPHASIYHGLVALLDALTDRARGPLDWGAGYVGWEIGLLRELGFGLDFSACAATGESEGLRWVSPRTGRAVSDAAAAPYRARLLKLPGFLLGGTPASAADVCDGLKLTGHFLARHGLGRSDRGLPAARDRFPTVFRRISTISGG